MVEVVEADAPAEVRCARGLDHPNSPSGLRSRGLPQPGEQERREQEAAENRLLERPLVAVDGQSPLGHEAAGIVRQHRDAGVPLEQLVRQVADVREPPVVRYKRRRAEGLGDPARALRIAADQGDLGPEGREGAGGGGPDPRASARHHDDEAGGIPGGRQRAHARPRSR
ncbi:hypothetical protein GCM10025866_01680 [Naasia aerilata]|uniref:Uncharacterized protein n=1 Tax=Naasia aerilata TaxID=1162966 RepID=A0ABM8G7V5_9MICO|nr:hypothetical protein GCM10025866_01680 [Naasia aerilata]